MIRELKLAGNNLSDEYKVQNGIRFLPDTWKQMRLKMTYNENIKTFDDLPCHLELEAERFEAAKASGSSYAAQSDSAGHLGRSARKIKVERMKILDLCLRRLILPNAREASVVVRRTKLARRVLTVTRNDTSRVIALVEEDTL